MAYESEMARLRAEELHIANKDGAFTEHEKQRLEQISQIFRAEPDLRALLIALEMRQREETDAMIEKLRSSEGGGIDKDDYADMLRRHHDERERHVQDFERARQMRRELDEVQQHLDRHLGHKL